MRIYSSPFLVLVWLCLCFLVIIGAKLRSPHGDNFYKRKLHEYEQEMKFINSANGTIEVSDLIKVKFSMNYFVSRLANKRIVFIGDSITRYQYLALVYSLSTGHFLNMSVMPNPVAEKTWHSWIDFYNQTNFMLHPNEYCDCFRDTYRPSHQNENRYYFDNSRNISIVYLSTIDSEHCFGHWSDWGDSDIWRSVQYSYTRPYWTLSFPDTVKWIKRDVFQKPINGIFTGKGDWKYGMGSQDSTYSILVMNIGAHEMHKFNDFNFTKQLRDTVFNEAKFDKFIWKTTTKKAFFIPVDFYYDDPNREYNYYRHDWLVCSLPNITCFNTSWTKRVNPQTLMWDSVHFNAPVYNHLNIELMKLLGP